MFRSITETISQYYQNYKANAEFMAKFEPATINIQKYHDDVLQYSDEHISGDESIAEHFNDGREIDHDVLYTERPGSGDDESVNVLYENRKQIISSEDEETYSAKEFAADVKYEDIRMKFNLMQHYLNEQFDKNESYSLAAQIFIGFSRDLMWGMATFGNFTFFPNFNAFWGKTFTQMIMTAPIVVASTQVPNSFTKMQIFNDNRSAWVSKQYIYAFASWSSIPIWNVAQILGAKCGETMGLNESNAGYFSGVFTGISETIWQNVLVIPAMLQQPVDALEPALNSLGGAVWQWVYQANFDAKNQTGIPLNTTNSTGVFSNDDMKVGFEIAAGVAISTFLMSTIARAIKTIQVRRNYANHEASGVDADNDTDVQLSDSESFSGRGRRRDRFYGSSQETIFQTARIRTNKVSSESRNNTNNRMQI